MRAATHFRCWGGTHHRRDVWPPCLAHWTTGGDGLADIIGRRFGGVKLPWNTAKSWAGSLAMFIGVCVGAWAHRGLGVLWTAGEAVAVPRSLGLGFRCFSRNFDQGPACGSAVS